MDLHSQEAVLRSVEEHGKENVIVILGAPDPESAEISAETVVMGDPSYAGPLAGVQLGLAVYHVLDEEVRKHIPPEVWEEQIGVMTDVLDAQGLSAAVTTVRGRGA
jgi:glycine/sarcosine/betaine reductase complex component A